MKAILVRPGDRVTLPGSGALSGKKTVYKVTPFPLRTTVRITYDDRTTGMYPEDLEMAVERKIS